MDPFFIKKSLFLIFLMFFDIFLAYIGYILLSDIVYQHSLKRHRAITTKSQYIVTNRHFLQLKFYFTVYRNAIFSHSPLNRISEGNWRTTKQR